MSDLSDLDRKLISEVPAWAANEITNLIETAGTSDADWEILRAAGEMIGSLRSRLKAARERYCVDTHAPHIRLVGEGELAYCTRCKGGEAELDEKTCDERVLIEHLRMMIECIDHANPGAFANGNTDPSGGIDEGEVMTSRVVGEAREALAEIEGKR